MSSQLVINNFSPRIFEHDYVVGVLGIEIPLNESTPYSDDLRRRIIEEQLLLEGFFDGFKELTGDMKTAGLAMRYVMEDPSRIKVFANEVMSTVDKKYEKLVEWMQKVLRLGKSVVSKFKAAETLVSFIEKMQGTLEATYEKVKSIAGWQRVLFALTAAVGVRFVWDKLKDSGLLDFDAIDKIGSEISESRHRELSLVTALYGDSLLKEESEDIPGISSESSSALKNLVEKVKSVAKALGANFFKGLAIDAIAGAVSGGIATLFKFLAKLFGGIKMVWSVSAGPIKSFVSKIENPKEEKKDAEAGKNDPTVKESLDRALKGSISIIPTQKYHFEHKGYPMSPEEQAKDLALVVAQYENKRVPEKLQQVCDEKFEKLFQVFLESQRKTYNIEYYEMLIDSLVPIIMKLKQYYGRPRPIQLAKSMGIDFAGDDLSSAQTPSYPSGHTIQAYVVAHMLSDQFPEYEDSLMKIAELVSQSRIDRGVHFPTDIEHGREIAESIHSQIKEGLGGETPQSKPVYE